ncbi:restriction endonuclease subunit S [Streptococcus sp. DD11]|uniref:restriction endonuclease subunit S n=1 Tax=Streptococcus sp. DD11 TaxID=1777879 RepID=UPI001008319E|nr:restriction endonuclease subunit S [Streptococcus sp. DD11]
MKLSDWKRVKLSDVCQINKNTYSASEKWEFINYLDTGNLTKNEVQQFQYIETGKDKLPSRARRKVEYNDILYSTVRPNQCHYGIVKDMLPNMLVSTGFAVITVDKSKVDSGYIYYYLTQNEIVETLHAIGEQSTSAYPSIKPSDISGLEISLPSLEIQREISGILHALDNKIENSNL